MQRFRIRQPTSVIRITLLVIATGASLMVPRSAAGQAKHYRLESADGLRLHNVTVEPAMLHGKKGLRLTLSGEATQRLERMSPTERAQARIDQLALIEGLDFSSGVIEVEVAGAPAAGAGEGARGFVGIAFRVQKDMTTYDAFYLRPTNGRAEDQERRNHSVQYISHPDWPWFRLRRETPSRYESYVDLMPGVWTRLRIEVDGERARLYVHGYEQPTLIVHDVKSGAHGKGAVALWADRGTVAHFRNLTVRPLRTAPAQSQMSTALAPRVDHHQHLLSPTLAARFWGLLPLDAPANILN